MPGIGTKVDPCLCRSNCMVGQVVGSVGTLPNVFMAIEINFFLLRRLLGIKADGSKKAKVYQQLTGDHIYKFTLLKVGKLSKDEILMINIGSTSTGGTVRAVKADLAKVSLTQPVCAEVTCTFV